MYLSYFRKHNKWLWFCAFHSLHLCVKWRCVLTSGDDSGWHQNDPHALWEQFLPQHVRESKQLLGTAWPEQVNKHKCDTESQQFCSTLVNSVLSAKMWAVTLLILVIIKKTYPSFNVFLLLSEKNRNCGKDWKPKSLNLLKFSFKS